MNRLIDIIIKYNSLTLKEKELFKQVIESHTEEINKISEKQLWDVLKNGKKEPVVQPFDWQKTPPIQNFNLFKELQIEKLNRG